MKFIKYLTFILTLVIWFSLKAYSQKVNLEDYKLRYPGESRVLLKNNTNYTIKQIGDSLGIEISRYEETLCLDENALLQAGQSLTYSGFYQIKKLEAQTLVPNKNKYKTIQVDKYDTSDYREPSIFYDDIKKISFKFPKIQPGAITKLNYTHILNDPRFISPIYFNDLIPVESIEISVTCPSNVNIGYKLFNCDSLKVEYHKESKGNDIVYHWKLNNVPKITIEEDAPDLTYYIGHIFIYIKDYSLKGKTIPVLSNTRDLFRWYSNFVSGVNNSPAPQLKHLVDSLTLGILNRDEKAKKLFYWVQDHIKYIAFEAGREGFVPRDAELVYNRRFGDCKDMASITKKMLDLAGIDGHFVWLGTRHLPYSYSDLSLPAVDNHMIAAYKKDNSWVFLDGTTGPHPFGIPSYMIQGKEALIYEGPDKYEIVKIPEIAPEQNLISDTLFIKLEGKKIIGHGISYFKGYSRFEMYHLIGQEDKSTQNSILKNYFNKGNNKFLIDNFTITNLTDRDKDLIISYNFNLADFAQLVGNEIFINLNMEKQDQLELIKPERKVAVESNFKQKTIHHVIFEIPQGFKINYLPPNTQFNREQFCFNEYYKSEQNSITLTSEYITNYLLLNNKFFKDWNDMISIIRDAYKESVSLIK